MPRPQPGPTFTQGTTYNYTHKHGLTVNTEENNKSHFFFPQLLKLYTQSHQSTLNLIRSSKILLKLTT